MVAVCITRSVAPRFVECVHCGRQMHQICVLHHDQIRPGGFQCDSCLSALGKKKKENKFVPRRKSAVFMLISGLSLFTCTICSSNIILTSIA